MQDLSRFEKMIPRLQKEVFWWGDKELNTFFKVLKSDDLSRVFAFRSAFRAMPMLGYSIGKSWLYPLTLTTFRSLIIASVSSKKRDSALIAAAAARFTSDARFAADVRFAADARFGVSAASAARFAAAAVHFSAADTAADARSAARYAIDAAALSDSASAARQIILDDMAFLIKNQNLDDFIAKPLWAGGMPQDLINLWVKFSNDLMKQEEFGFFVNWANARINGEKQNIARDYDIAIIPGENWEKGAALVAQIIKEIELNHKEFGKTLSPIIR